MVLLGFGSNLGQRQHNILTAIARLQSHAAITVKKVSSLYETEPFGYKDQDYFLNAVAQIETTLEPLELLHVCQRIESELGRSREIHWGPRTLDIDLLLFDQVRMQTPELTLPHPYLTQRRFVLLPLAEITQEPLVDGRTAAELLRLCPDEGEVALFDAAR